MLLHEADAAFLGGPFSIMERLEGTTLWPVLAGAPPCQARHLLDRFGSLLARLHQLDWRPFTEHAALYEANPTAILDELLASSRWLYRQFDVGGFLAIVDWLQTHASDVAVQPAVVHQDFHANNVFLCNDDRLAVIDWTQIAVSDCRTDLSWTLMIMGDHGRPEWGERILQAYGRAAACPPDDLTYFSVIAFAKLLASRVICLKAGPEQLGLHPGTADATRAELPILRKLSQRVRDITGITIPEVESALSHIG
jgi:aminoglycoside phosphotransferase (APT) family kinase protein